MPVLLAGPDFEENLSIRYLASPLQANGHETLLAVFNSADDLEAVAEQAGDANIVGLSVCSQQRARISHPGTSHQTKTPQSWSWSVGRVKPIS